MFNKLTISLVAFLVALGGVSSAAWWQYGEITPAAMVYIVQDTTDVIRNTVEPSVSPQPTIESNQPSQTPAPSPEQPVISPQPAPIEKPIQQELQAIEPEEQPQRFVDPKEVRQVLRQIVDMRRELKRFAAKVKKMPNNQEDVTKISNLLAMIEDFNQKIKSSIDEDLADVIQEFHEAGIWDEINKIRIKIELPQQIKSAVKELKKLKKLITTKSFQNLGLDISRVASYIQELEDIINKFNEVYNSGDLEEAMALAEDLQEVSHPGEVVSVFYRLRDIRLRLKRVRDTEIKAEIEDALNEIISTFNNGDFREARELMDESFNDLMQIINQATQIGRKGVTKDKTRESIDRLQQKLDEKMGGKDKINLPEEKD